MICLPVWIVVVWYLATGVITTFLLDYTNCIKVESKFNTVLGYISVFFGWPFYAFIIVNSIVIEFIALSISYIQIEFDKQRGDKR